MIDTLAELVAYGGGFLALAVPVALAVLALWCAFASPLVARRRARRRYEVGMRERARRIELMAASIHSCRLKGPDQCIACRRAVADRV